MAAGENYPLFSSISNCPMIVYLRAVRIRTLVRNACRSHPRVKTVSHVYPRETRRQNIGSFTFLWPTNIFWKKKDLQEFAYHVRAYVLLEAERPFFGSCKTFYVKRPFFGSCKTFYAIWKFASFCRFNALTGNPSWTSDVQFSSVPWPICSSGGHQGRFNKDPLRVFSAGGPCLMLSSQHFFCQPQRIPNSKVLERLS